MDTAVFLSFISFAFVASITPGPNNLMVMASGAAFGWKRTLPHLIGIAMGFAVLISATVLGLGVVLQRIPYAFDLMRAIGVVWLLWLAWQLAAPALRTTDGESGSDGPTAGARPFTVLQAAAFQWVNPKSWTMAIAATGAYSGLATSAGVRAALMAATFIVIAPLCNGAWLMAGGALQRLLDNPGWRRVALLSMAVLIVASAGLIAFG